MNISELNELNIIEHYQDFAKRTLIDKGEFKNKVHCLLGLVGEINELIDAVRFVDEVNIKEELGDLTWFITNIMTLYKIKFIDTYEKSQYNTNRFFSTENLNYSISELANLMKRELIFDKTISGDIEGYVNNVFAEIECISAYFKILFEDVLLSNIKKLENRNKNKGIGDLENRDLKQERDILEN